MARLQLTWTIHQDRGLVTFGRPLPFSGNTYDLTIVGAEGAHYVAYLMDDSGINCLAKSEYADGVYTIAFTSEALWNEFIREPHETRPFHLFIRSATLEGDALIEHDTVAEGDLTLLWNPLWTDKEVGRAYTMQGREGRPGAPGIPGDIGPEGKSAYELAVKNGFKGTIDDWLDSLRGQPGRTTSIHSSDNLWRKVTLVQDEYAQWSLRVDTEGEEVNPDETQYVSRTATQTIEGRKTFSVTPQVPALSDADNSLSVPPTNWVRRVVSAALNTLKSAAQTITGQWDFWNVTVEKVYISNTLGVGDRGRTNLNGTIDIPGKTDISGNLTARDVTPANLTLDNSCFAKTSAVNCSDIYTLLNLILQRCDGNWVYFPGETLPSDYNGYEAGSTTATTLWREPGGANLRTTDYGAIGLFGLKTTSIAENACRNAKYLRYIDFPNVTNVAYCAFAQELRQSTGNYLYGINLPKCTNIGASAFENQNYLHDINIENVKTIGTRAFYYAGGGETISQITLNLPKCTSIGEEAFRTAPNATDTLLGVIYAPNVTDIGADAFKNQHKLSEVRITGKTVEEIREMANFPWGVPDTCEFVGSNGRIMSDGVTPGTGE